MSKKLTQEQVDTMLTQLQGHFNEPVLPLSHYCAKLETWVKCLEERAERLGAQLFPHLNELVNNQLTKEAIQARADHDEARKNRNMDGQTDRDYELRNLWECEEAVVRAHVVGLAVKKSSLLARLLYDGEKLRTKQCPTHKGQWSGLPHPGNDCECGLTGWLPQPEDVERWTRSKAEYEAKLCHSCKMMFHGCAPSEHKRPSCPPECPVGYKAPQEEG
jgi:hypothetical protein